MATPRVMVLRAPGTNCDHETAHAFQLAGAQAERIHVNRLLEDQQAFTDWQIICLPGGFSYGDDLAAGRILGNQIRHHLADRLEQFRADGGLILGICNGFQILIRSGLLLPDRAAGGTAATLTFNDSGKFEDRWVNLRVASERCVFFRGIQSMYLPVAHAEGKFVVHDENVMNQLEADGQLVLRYTSGDEQSSVLEGVAAAAGTTLGTTARLTNTGALLASQVSYPANPNGSQSDIAGICDATGRVCGLMPHPERFVDRLQHPRWTREQLPAAGDGLQVFINAVEYFA